MTIRTGPNNHVEMVHRPGEGHLAAKVLGLLGYEMTKGSTDFAGATWWSSADKVLWLSEVTPEQWAFEQWLQQQLSERGGVDGGGFAEGVKVLPQKYPHFGLGKTSLEDWERTVARLLEAVEHDPELAGRVSLPLVKRPEDEGSVAQSTGGRIGRTLYQAFVRTDIFASGLLTLGQGIEVQHYRENDPAWAGEAAELAVVG
jgi:hypothetical protein